MVASCGGHYSETTGVSAVDVFEKSTIIGFNNNFSCLVLKGDRIRFTEFAS